MREEFRQFSTEIRSSREVPFTATQIELLSLLSLCSALRKTTEQKFTPKQQTGILRQEKLDRTEIDTPRFVIGSRALAKVTYNKSTRKIENGKKCEATFDFYESGSIRFLSKVKTPSAHPK